MEQVKKSGLVKAGKVLGILGLIFALLPLVSGWFILLTWLAYLLGLIGLILAIIALVKKYNGAIVAIVLTIASIIAPICLREVYAKKALESAANAVENAGTFMKSAGDMMEELEEQEDSDE